MFVLQGNLNLWVNFDFADQDYLPCKLWKSAPPPLQVTHLILLYSQILEEGKQLWDKG